MRRSARGDEGNAREEKAVYTLRGGSCCTEEAAIALTERIRPHALVEPRGRKAGGGEGRVLWRWRGGGGAGAEGSGGKGAKNLLSRENERERAG